MPHSLTLHPHPLPILIRRHPRARRMIVRYSPLKRAVHLTLPRHASVAQGLRFVEEKRPWICEQIAKHPPPIPLTDGQQILLFGQPYRLCHVGGRGLVRLEGDRILIPGDPHFGPRRVIHWLKQQLGAEIIRLSNQKRLPSSKPIKKITLRDTTSRWGSCSHKGVLSFSWRLVFAPYAVLDYVVSHEIAHLTHPHHDPTFWKEVAALCPGYETHRDWLTHHGQSLYRFQMEHSDILGDTLGLC